MSIVLTLGGKMRTVDISRRSEAQEIRKYNLAIIAVTSVSTSLIVFAPEVVDEDLIPTINAALTGWWERGRARAKEARKAGFDETFEIDGDGILANDRGRPLPFQEQSTIFQITANEGEELFVAAFEEIV